MTKRYADIIKRSITKEDKVIGNLKAQFVKPTVEAQKKIGISPDIAVGNIALAYYRGLAVGEEDRTKAIVSILKKHSPNLAKMIKDKYSKKH